MRWPRRAALQTNEVESKEASEDDEKAGRHWQKTTNNPTTTDTTTPTTTALRTAANTRSKTIRHDGACVRTGERGTARRVRSHTQTNKRTSERTNERMKEGMKE